VFLVLYSTVHDIYKHALYSKYPIDRSSFTSSFLVKNLQPFPFRLEKNAFIFRPKLHLNVHVHGHFFCERIFFFHDVCFLILSSDFVSVSVRFCVKSLFFSSCSSFSVPFAEKVSIVARGLLVDGVGGGSVVWHNPNSLKSAIVGMVISRTGGIAVMTHSVPASLFTIRTFLRFTPMDVLLNSCCRALRSAREENADNEDLLRWCGVFILSGVLQTFVLLVLAEGNFSCVLVICVL